MPSRTAAAAAVTTTHNSNNSNTSNSNSNNVPHPRTIHFVTTLPYVRFYFLRSIRFYLKEDERFYLGNGVTATAAAATATDIHRHLTAFFLYFFCYDTTLAAVPLHIVKPNSITTKKTVRATATTRKKSILKEELNDDDNDDACHTLPLSFYFASFSLYLLIYIYIYIRSPSFSASTKKSIFSNTQNSSLHDETQHAFLSEKPACFCWYLW